MENNQAFVARLDNIQPIAGADKIVQADIMLKGIKITQVVVSKDTEPGTFVVYFDSNMCLEQNVIDIIDKADPNFGKEGFLSLGNYLAKGNRVRVVKLRGVISNGLAVERDKFLQFCGVGDTLIEGDSFIQLGTTPICHKYQPPVKVVHVSGKKGKKVKKVSRMIPDQFHFHVDTDQLPRNMHRIFPNQVISISRKIHGTSAIVSNCLVKRKLSLKDKIAKFFGIPVLETEYDYVYASRTVIKNDATTPGFYGSDIWTQEGERNFKGKLHQGESVYYEIVGYLPGGGAIQKGYPYGCLPGTCKIAVYRITSTAADGSVVEYGWKAMQERCIELGVPMVEEYFYGSLDTVHHCFTDQGDVEGLAYWRAGLLELLRKLYLEKDAFDCNNMPDEGVVIRIEGLHIEAYKLKSEKFLLKESKAKEEGQEDLEEQEIVDNSSNNA